MNAPPSTDDDFPVQMICGTASSELGGYVERDRGARVLAILFQIVVLTWILKPPT